MAAVWNKCTTTWLVDSCKYNTSQCQVNVYNVHVSFRPTSAALKKCYVRSCKFQTSAKTQSPKQINTTLHLQKYSTTVSNKCNTTSTSMCVSVRPGTANMTAPRSIHSHLPDDPAAQICSKIQIWLLRTDPNLITEKAPQISDCNKTTKILLRKLSIHNIIAWLGLFIIPHFKCHILCFKAVILSNIISSHLCHCLGGFRVLDYVQLWGLGACLTRKSTYSILPH